MKGNNFKACYRWPIQKSLPLLFFIIGLMTVVGLPAQGQYENVWAFGDKSGLDFNNNGRTAIATSINSNESSASICDEDGQLLFYTDGESVWNRNHKLMPNGRGLTYAGHGTKSTSQGSLIFPMPGSLDKYYIFSLSDNEKPNGLYQGGGSLFYSVVDMQMDNRLGNVDPFIKSVPLDTLLTEHMIAVTGDDCNVWLLVISLEGIRPSYNQQDTSLMKLKAYNIDHTGVSTSPVISLVAATSHTTFYAKWIGGMAASPDGKRIAISGGGLWLYDFDRVSGTVRNPWELAPWPERPTNQPFYDQMFFYSTCFSSDNSKLYGSTNRRVFQFDLSSNNFNTVLNSRYTVCDTTELIEYGSGLKRGPDEKIYVAHYTFPSLSLINNPNLPGAACGFIKDAVLLSGKSGIGLSNAVPVPDRDTFYNGRQNDTAACFSATHLLGIDTTAVKVVWDDGSTDVTREVSQSGTYWVIYRLPPCLNHRYIDTFKVVFRSGKSLLPQVSTQAACKGIANGRAWVTPVAGDTNSYTYAWRDANHVLRSSSDTLAPMLPGKYTLQVSSSFGCDTIIDIFIPEEIYKVSFDSDPMICQGTYLRLVNTSYDYFTEFRWSFGNGDSSLLADPPAQHYPHPGSYEVTLSGKGLVCRDTFLAKVIVSPLPEVTALPEEATILYGSSMRLHASGAQTYSWSPADYLDDPYSADPLAVSVLKSIRYTVTGNNEWGCSDTAEVRIYIDNDRLDFMPNAFSPNGDGLNDVFKVGRLNYQTEVREFRVYNRWGACVFQAFDSIHGWDGTYNEEPADAGTYYYRIRLSYPDGTEKECTGDVLLIR